MYGTVIEQKEILNERNEDPEHVLENPESLDLSVSSSEHQQCASTILENRTVSEELTILPEADLEYDIHVVDGIVLFGIFVFFGLFGTFI